MSSTTRSLVMLLAAMIVCLTSYIIWSQTSPAIAPTSPDSVPLKKTYIHPRDGYSLEYGTGWYPHELESQVIFTRSSEFELPLGSEGYAFGPQIVVRRSTIDRDYTDVTTQSEFKTKVTDPGPDQIPVVQSTITLNGLDFWRVERPAMLADGQEVTYYYFITEKEYISLYHWPYEVTSAETQGFEAMLNTLKIQGTSTVPTITPPTATPKPVVDKKQCQTDADCGLLVCSGCFNTIWLQSALPDLACRKYEGYSCVCRNNLCQEVK